jgi:outer membrane lipoprotein-sorting protein
VNTDSGFKRVELAFVEQQLQQMVFFDNLEQTTFVALDNVIVNEPIDAGRFEFVVPTGVDVVGQPASAKLTAD